MLEFIVVGELLSTLTPFVVSLSNHNQTLRKQRLASVSFDRFTACSGMLEARDERRLMEVAVAIAWRYA